jgi:hypothetical protein
MSVNNLELKGQVGNNKPETQCQKMGAKLSLRYKRSRRKFQILGRLGAQNWERESNEEQNRGQKSSLTPNKGGTKRKENKSSR